MKQTGWLDMAEGQSENIEEVRRRKMAEAYQSAQARAAQEEQLRAALGNILEPAAYERLMLVKMSNPAAFAKVVGNRISAAGRTAQGAPQ